MDITNWNEVIFGDDEGELWERLYPSTPYDRPHQSEKWPLTEFQKSLLAKIPSKDYCRGEILFRSKLKEEKGEWNMINFKEREIMATGGEAIILSQYVDGLNVAVRVQAFDPALFTKDYEKYNFLVHLSKGTPSITGI